MSSSLAVLLYVFAASVTLTFTAVVVLGSLWIRGGRDAIQAHANWIVTSFAAIVGLMALMTLLFQGGFGRAVDFVAGALSAVLAALFLARRPIGGTPQPPWYRVGMIAALAISAGIVVAVLFDVLAR